MPRSQLPLKPFSTTSNAEMPRHTFSGYRRVLPMNGACILTMFRCLPSTATILMRRSHHLRLRHLVGLECANDQRRVDVPMCDDRIRRKSKVLVVSWLVLEKC